MVQMRNIVIIAVLVLGLVASGCADKGVTVEEGTIDNDTEQKISVADEYLSEEMVGITDSEIQDMEAEIAELEALLAEMETEENIISEEI